MSRIAKLFTKGRSQAVRIPAAFRFDTEEVFIRQNPETGDVILSRKPEDWAGFFAVIEGGVVPADYLDARERGQVGHKRSFEKPEPGPFDS